MSGAGWIGVDLDGTLAEYDHWRGADHIGAPIPKMLTRVHRWLDGKYNVKIFTARVAGDDHGAVRAIIETWCLKYIGEVLPVTNKKDYGMIELWDDRAVQVIANTGERVDGGA
jgi:hypothetical protein